LVALGVNVSVRVTNMVNFGYASFILWGPLAVLVLNQQFHVPLAFAFLLSLVGVLICSLLVERVALRPFLGSGSALPWMLSTLAVGTVLERFAEYQFGGEPQPFTHNFGLSTITVLGIHTNWVEIATVLVGIVFSVLIVLYMAKTVRGRKLNAVAQDPDGAAMIGISVRRASQEATIIVAVIAVVIGWIAAPSLQVGSSLGLTLLFTGFVAAALGGFASITGSWVGGVLLGLVLQLGNDQLGPNYINVLLFGTLLVVYLVRPQGLFGDRTIRSV
ncbi:MAG TPA: branched-chain amino acid ABC transporter permease, partial [Jatrophihabitans sp.]